MEVFHGCLSLFSLVIPVKALPPFVIPAESGIQFLRLFRLSSKSITRKSWIPAFAGMTKEEALSRE
jgi:hypothetical protein